VLGVDGLDDDRSLPDRVALGHDLGAVAGGRDDGMGRGRADDARRPLEHPQRADVEVVAMGVGEQHEIDPGQLLVGRLRGDPAQHLEDPRPQQRIGHHPHPVDLDQDRRMPEVGDGGHRSRSQGCPTIRRPG